VEAPASWPIFTLSQEIGAVEPGEAILDEDRAEFSLVDGWASLRRSPAQATLTFPRKLGEGEMAHPYLTKVAAVHTYWLGWESFHAGAFLVGDRAWAVAALRGGGKTSTLAGLSRAGYKVMVDDLVVVESGKVFAGPRSLDLRGGASSYLGMGESAGFHYGRDRFRHRLLGDVPAEVELAGWIFLAWGESLEVVALSPLERLQHLIEHRMIKGPAELEPTGLLGLAALPGFLLTRIQSFNQFDDTLRAIAGIVS